MTLQLHPEEALDLAMAGELPVAEQQVLDQHLAACRACRAHLTLARASQTASSPQPWDNQLNRQTVDSALARFERSRWSAFFLFQRRWLLLTAGMLLAAGGMASAAWWHRESPAPEAVSSPGSSASHAEPTPRKLAMVQHEAPLPWPSEPSDERQNAPRTMRGQPSAALLFEQASALRARNQPDEAIAVFRKLQQLFPKSRESRISFALAGRILLDRGRPAQALAQFDQHLVQGGEASEEALAGRATALGQMGRLSAEREAWQRLLNAYPKSVYANQAKEHLAPAFPAVEPSR